MEELQAHIAATCPVPFSGVTGGLFLNAITTAITAHCLIIDEGWPKDDSKEIIEQGPGASYDFVIVGAGTAGSLIASSLSKIKPSWSILLIEAGNDPGVDSEVPAFLFLNQNSESDWFYKTHPDGKSCLGFKNRSCIWSKGKCMGGSSSINAMLYIRGHPNDYNNWEHSGNPGWGYNDLQKYFEIQEELFNISDPEFSGYDYKWYDIIDKAWKELGYKNYNYLEHEALTGTRKVRILTNNGKRVNTAKVYLHTRAKNIKVMKNTEVENVIINPKSNVVTGLKIRTSDGTYVNIKVNREVVLAAGSIGTPVILMKSGIGPRSYFSELGIECVQDLPVGKNLQDHLIFPIFLKTNLQDSVDPTIFNLLILQYILTKTGPLSNIGITDYMGFINTNGTSDEPDIQFHFTYFPKNNAIVIRPYLEGIGYESEIIDIIESINVKHDFLGIYPTLLHPKSMGEILLNKDKTAFPIIKANYLTHPDDLATLLKSIDFLRELEKTLPFKELGINIIHIPIPGCLELNFESEEYWQCYIKHMATTIYHPVGTAKMGPDGDNSTVVNNNLKVHNIHNLRVADASIMPTIPGGNTMAATLVIAQKAVDIIKKEYAKKDEL